MNPNFPTTHTSLSQRSGTRAHLLTMSVKKRHRARVSAIRTMHFPFSSINPHASASKDEAHIERRRRRCTREKASTGSAALFSLIRQEHLSSLTCACVHVYATQLVVGRVPSLSRGWITETRACTRTGTSHFFPPHMCVYLTVRRCCVIYNIQKPIAQQHTQVGSLWVFRSALVTKCSSTSSLDFVARRRALCNA